MSGMPSQALDWNLLDYEPHRQIKQLVADLNHLYRAEPSLHEVDFDWQGFEWIDFHDADNSVVAFLRRARDPKIIWLWSATSRRSRTPATASACRNRASIARSSILTMRNMAAAALTNAPGRQAAPAPWQNQPCHHRDNLAAAGRRVFKPEPSRQGSRAAGCSARVVSGRPSDSCTQDDHWRVPGPRAYIPSTSRSTRWPTSRK